MTAAPLAVETPANSLGWFLFSFRGRVGRAEFWRFIAVVSIVGILLGTVNALLVMAALDWPLAPVYGLLIAYPYMAVLAKRWHDRDKSGWWVLLQFVPVAGLLWILVECGFLAGNAGPNRFGAPPDPADS